MTYQEFALQALDVQDVCNLSGVVHSRTGCGKAGEMSKPDTVVGLRRYEVEIVDSKYPVEQPIVMYVNGVDNREARKRIHEALRKDGWKREDYHILSVRQEVKK
jgi:hypothetical protein